MRSEFFQFLNVAGCMNTAFTNQKIVWNHFRHFYQPAGNIQIGFSGFQIPVVDANQKSAHRKGFFHIFFAMSFHQSGHADFLAQLK